MTNGIPIAPLTRAQPEMLSLRPPLGKTTSLFDSPDGKSGSPNSPLGGAPRSARRGGEAKS